MSRWRIISRNISPLEAWRAGFRWLLAAAYGAVGLVHLLSPDGFLPILPDWVPYPRDTILFTGACEIAGAIGLLIPGLRRLAGIMLALYAVCVFPANIKHAIDAVPINGVVLNGWYHAPRLALQPILVWWALFCGGLVTWPFRTQKGAVSGREAPPGAR